MPNGSVGKHASAPRAYQEPSRPCHQPPIRRLRPATLWPAVR
jgi:hypothetical protein